MAPQKPGGIGAVGSAVARFFHPSARIRERWPNEYQKLRVPGVVVVGKGQHRINRKVQVAYECRIPAIDDSTTFHIVCSNFRVDEAPATPFEDESFALPVAPRTTAADRNQQLRASLTNDDENGLGAREVLAEHVAQLRAQGIEVDDDEEALPENVPQGPPVPTLMQVGEWITPTICPRKADDRISDVDGQWKNVCWTKVAYLDELEIFRMAFPEDWFKNVVLKETNKFLNCALTLSEAYVWLGCRFFHACFEGVDDVRHWWSEKEINMYEGAPFRLNEYMTLSRFMEISAAMRYTDVAVPEFEDKFHEVRQMIKAYNDHYEANYIPGSENCLDESMNSYLNKYCPGFMVVPRKPHPQGNEYHSICDGKKGSPRELAKPILWRIKIQEGKDRPKLANGRFAFSNEFETRGSTKTESLMLWMTKPIHNTGKRVTMDSGFSVTAGILALHDHGVYGQALAKKRRWWPKHVPGDQIEKYFEGKELGDVMTLKQDLGGKQFLVHCTNDDKYVTKLMSTHGLIRRVDDHSTYRCVDGEWKSFKYPEPLSFHNRAKHWVDDHNNRRHDPIGLEDVWGTKWWPTRQFTFICGLAEVNAANSRARARGENTEPQLKFRRRLAKCMLENRLDEEGRNPGSPARLRKRARAFMASDHEHLTRPAGTGKWNPARSTWKRLKSKYSKTKCATCPRTCRTYCSCDRSVVMCKECWAMHLGECSRTL